MPVVRRSPDKELRIGPDDGLDGNDLAKRIQKVKGSDAGNLRVIEHNPKNEGRNRILQETFPIIRHQAQLHRNLNDRRSDLGQIENVLNQHIETQGNL